jgi:pyruvate dehydrogenase (quinone)
MSKKVADIIVETLESAGVKHCYGVVGDTLNMIAHGISKSAIEWVGVRHEEAGAFAAQGEASLTGTLTAVAGSCGPGSLHFINGIVEANRNRAPVILIASQIVRDELGFDFPQEVDFKAIYGSCSVYCDMILTPEQARRKTVMACQTAIAKRGVAVLIVPVDISHSDVHDDVPFAVHTSHPIVRPTDADLDEIAAIINSGQQIAIYGGAGCRGAHNEILRVAEILKAPIAHTSRGKDSLEYDNPYNVGMTGILGNEAGYHALRNCDTLLMLGADFAWRQFYPEHAKIVQIDIEPSHLGRRHPVTRGLVGDIKATLEALIPRLHEKPDTQFRDGFVNRYREVIAHQKEKAVPKRRGTISGIYLTELIDQMAADDALITGDDGTPTVWMHRYFKATAERRFFASLLHGTMAAAMPTALGLQKAAPGRKSLSRAMAGSRCCSAI